MNKLVAVAGVLGFGFLCFVAGIEAKAGHPEVAVVQILAGLVVLGETFGGYDE